MAQPKSAPAAAPIAPPSEKVRVRVLVQTYGGERAPIGRYGDVIEIDRVEYDKAGPDVFALDGVLEAKAQEQAKRDEDSAAEHFRQRESMAAAQRSAAQARARVAREQAQYAERVAKDAEAKAQAL